MNVSRFLLLCGLLAAAGTLRADFTIASPFTDHAVLQRDVAVPVWGTSDHPGATLTVSFAGQNKETRVNASGIWRVDLDPMPATAAGSDLVVTEGARNYTLRDVVVGEVWLASGQSNMEWTVRNSRGYEEEKSRPENPLIRHLRVDLGGADLPATRVPTSGWQVAAPGTVGGFSATAFFFAQALSAKLGIPIGILNSSWGGTAIESWIPEPVLRSTRAWPKVSADLEAAFKVFPQRYAEQPALEKAWAQALADNKATGKPITMEWPRPPIGPGSGFAPARLYNAMIAPLAPYALRGALWYQGEANAGRPREYAELLPAMIQAWRHTWPLGHFPFLVVQLPAFENGKPGNATERGWAYMREAQATVRQVPATGLAVLIDADEPTDLHPTNKRLVGERLAFIALRNVFGDGTVEFAGPEFLAMTRVGATLRVQFEHADGLRSTQPVVKGFEIAGADRAFHPADARIDGSAVVVSSPAVTDPVAVRYAFTNAPENTLANAAGLPAMPFRTDDW